MYKYLHCSHLFATVHPICSATPHYAKVILRVMAAVKQAELKTRSFDIWFFEGPGNCAGGKASSLFEETRWYAAQQKSRSLFVLPSKKESELPCQQNQLPFSTVPQIQHLSWKGLQKSK